MNREILFRGKRQGSTEWVLGFYNEFANPKTGEHEYFIQTVKPNGRIDVIHKVEPETVGQYIGLKDKNGNKVFEGDIVIIPGIGYVRTVEYHENRFCLVGRFRVFTGVFYLEDWAIIGNIHDNPELLEAEKCGI